jgi:hypothetical protein
LKPDQLRALSTLAGNPNGCTEATLIAQGFTVDSLVEVIEAGLVSAMTKRVIVSQKPIEVKRLHITEAGRRLYRGGLPGGLRDPSAEG